MFENVNLSNLFDSSNKAVIIFTIRDGAVVYINDTAKSLYGYELEPTKKLNFTSIDPHFHLRFENVFDMDLNNLKTNIPHYDAQNNEISVEVIYFIATIDGTSVCFSIATPSKSDNYNKEKFDLSFYKLEQAINNSPLSIVITDISGNIEYVNPKFTDITGYSSYEAIGNNPRILKSGHQGEEFYRNLWNTITRGDTWEGEFLNRTKHGELFWEYARISPIYDNQKNIVGFIGLKEDLSKIKMLEESVKEHNFELLNMIREIKDKQPNLIQNEKLKSLGNLAAGIAHEINNPISYVRNNIKLLEDELTNYLNLIGDMIPEEKIIDYEFFKEELPDILNESLEGLDRVSGIVKTLRRFTSIDQFKEYQLVSINDAIDDALDVCSFGKEDSSIEIVKNFNFTDLYLAIPNDINQILYNVINNSMEAIYRKSKIEESPVKSITLSTFKENSNLIIQIKDTGDGIKKDDLNHIYDPFFTTKPVGSGTGLGLNFVYDIVTNNYKGKIDVNSEYKQYTDVTITLPIYRRVTPKEGLGKD